MTEPGRGRYAGWALRVTLIYPPPWKIAEPGDPSDPDDGPPADHGEGDLDADFFQIPFGLLSLAAQAIRAGHSVRVLNLSSYPWNSVRGILSRLDSDVVGLSCWTANRRGVALVADELKRVDPRIHVTVGGPHATALAEAMLKWVPCIDSVVRGEGELTFLELLDRLTKGQSLDGLAGASLRSTSGITRGPERSRLEDLDQLASPHALFATHILMTSRGCPWSCSFCGAETSWGRGFRSHGVPRILDDLEQALDKVRVRLLLFKDDTFTTDRRRVLALCQGIRERGLSFLWSGDTRADVLDEELVLAMRLAGCERLSLGVESGSPRILKSINKRTTLQQIRHTTELCRRYGVSTRYYMMLGNRGETRATFRESLDFLEQANPNQSIFSCLSIYPGTRDFRETVAKERLDPEIYFREQFLELKAPFDASADDTRLMDEWFRAHRGVRTHFVPSVDDAASALAALGGAHHAAHVALAEALVEEGQLDEAERQLQLAERLSYPLPGLIHNLRACIAHRRGDLLGLKEELITAARVDPQHHILLQNAASTRRWFEQGARGPLALRIRHEFELYERTEQPLLPGPLPSDWQVWDRPSAVCPAVKRLV